MSDSNECTTPPPLRRQNAMEIQVDSRNKTLTVEEKNDIILNVIDHMMDYRVKKLDVLANHKTMKIKKIVINYLYLR